MSVVSSPWLRRRDDGIDAVLAPLVRVVLDVRLVIMLVVLLGLSLADRGVEALSLLVLMALTSAGPVLLWRRWGGWVLRHPFAMVLDLTVSVGVLLAGASATLGLGYVACTVALAAILYGLRGGLALSAPVVLVSLAPVLDGDWLGAVVPAVLLLLAVRLGSTLRTLLLDLERARDRVRRSAHEAATARERERLARELHDSVAKTVQGVGLSAAALERSAQASPALAGLCRQIQADTRQAVRETRALLHGLRLDDVTVPLADSIADIVATFSRLNDLEVTATVEPVTDLGDDERYAVVQVLREALRNVSEHAAADHVEVSLSARDGHARLVVRDDGAGFVTDDVPAGHYGLSGMRERAADVGGDLQVDSVHGSGTTVALTVPTTTGVPA